MEFHIFSHSTTRINLKINEAERADWILGSGVINISQDCEFFLYLIGYARQLGGI